MDTYRMPLGMMMLMPRARPLGFFLSGIIHTCRYSNVGPAKPVSVSRAYCTVRLSIDKVCMSMSMFMSVSICLYVYMSMSICLYVHVYMSMFICLCLCMQLKPSGVRWYVE